MYYRLDMNSVEENTFVRSVSHREVMLTTGQPLSRVESLPFRFEMEVDEFFDGFDPDVAETSGTDDSTAATIFAYYRNVGLMHRSLVDTLQRAGADNLQIFPAIIRRLDSGEELHEHVVVNVVGIVSCAKLTESDSHPLGKYHYFHSLVIDPNRVGGLRLFRLAEYPPEILVHESVGRTLMAASFRGLVVDPVAEARLI